MSEGVSVVVVTHDSARTLSRTLDAIGRLEHRPLELVVVDCASRDESRGVTRDRWPADLPGRPLPLGENRGFAGGVNAGIAATGHPWVLSLNPDAEPRPDFLSRLLEAAEAVPRCGAVTGRLLRSAEGPGGPLLDACGMRLAPTWRHLDRASGERDRGQYAHRARVFAGTGAATLYRREALLDVAIEGEVFDEAFHSFREDAELGFRLRERGWEAVYEPTAVARHERFNLPERRRSMPAVVNFHSLKNRYLLRFYHQTVPNLVWTLPCTLWRDLLALGWVLVAERSSLAAYAWLWRERGPIRARRRAIQARRTVPGRSIDRWFLRSDLPCGRDG